MTAAAACLDTPTDVFFPTQIRGGKLTYDELHAPALAICASCPIRRQCLADHRDERFGVWGGTTPQDRGFKPSSGNRSERQPTAAAA